MAANYTHTFCSERRKRSGRDGIARIRPQTRPDPAKLTHAGPLALWHVLRIGLVRGASDITNGKQNKANNNCKTMKLPAQDIVVQSLIVKRPTAIRNVRDEDGFEF